MLTTILMCFFFKFSSIKWLTNTSGKNKISFFFSYCTYGEGYDFFFFTDSDNFSATSYSSHCRISVLVSWTFITASDGVGMAIAIVANTGRFNFFLIKSMYIKKIFYFIIDTLKKWMWLQFFFECTVLEKYW